MILPDGSTVIYTVANLKESSILKKKSYMETHVLMEQHTQKQQYVLQIFSKMNSMNIPVPFLKVS